MRCSHAECNAVLVNILTNTIILLQHSASTVNGQKKLDFELSVPSLHLVCVCRCAIPVCAQCKSMYTYRGKCKNNGCHCGIPSGISMSISMTGTIHSIVYTFLNHF